MPAAEKKAIDVAGFGATRAADTVAGMATMAAVAARRWQILDPLLPALQALGLGCGAELVVGSGGSLAAAGICEHWTGDPASLDLTWGASHRFILYPYVGDLEVDTAFDRLLGIWRDHLSAEHCAGSDDTSAVVTWPSRDVGGVKSLLRHGLAPLAVVAARTHSGHAGRSKEGRAIAAGQAEVAGQVGVRVRRAGPSDIDEAVRLGLEVIRFDALVCGVTERPGTADALRRELSALLAEREPWVWLAERDGGAVGMLAAERPEAARWIAPMVRAAPAGYLLLMGISAGERGKGIGAAMAAHLHRDAEAAGVAVMLLHYAQVNPLSAPFWSRQGYRPLWTVWEAVPARTLR